MVLQQQTGTHAGPVTRMVARVGAALLEQEWRLAVMAAAGQAPVAL